MPYPSDIPGPERAIASVRNQFADQRVRAERAERRVAVLEAAANRLLACFDSQRKWEAEAQGCEEEAALDALEAALKEIGE